MGNRTDKPKQTAQQLTAKMKNEKGIVLNIPLKAMQKTTWQILIIISEQPHTEKTIKNIQKVSITANTSV